MIQPCAILLAAAALTAAEPVSPSTLRELLTTHPTGPAAEKLAARVRATFPKTDLKRGAKPLVEKELVAFAIEVDGSKQKPAKAPRMGGMLNHGRGVELVAIGETGLWALVEEVATDTKFSYQYDVDGKRVGGGAIEMPGWKYPPESSERPGVKYGKYEPLAFRSEVFANNRKGWIYVPASYQPDGPPAAVMIFQDGSAYKNEHVGTVVDNLIESKKMPTTILILLDPGVNDDGRSNRSVEYDTLDDRYARFLAEEALPRVAKLYKLRTDAASRAIGGASSGGICAFNVAWRRPDLCGRVCSQIGSFTNIRGGGVFPDLVRQAEKKPIKVFLADGTNDIINRFGDWWQANNAMYAALVEKGYDVHFLKDRGFHAFWTCGRQLPEALAWTWSDPAPGK